MISTVVVFAAWDYLLLFLLLLMLRQKMYVRLLSEIYHKQPYFLLPGPTATVWIAA